MTDRTLSYGAADLINEDIATHGLAVLQTRIERVPGLIRGLPCQEPDGCGRPAALATLAVERAIDSDSAFGLCLAKDDVGMPHCIVVCDDHRSQASHDLFYRLTERLRPDGVRVFDLPGQHLQWT